MSGVQLEALDLGADVENSRHFNQRLSDILIDLIDQDLVDRGKIMVRMDHETLMECGLVSNTKSYKKKEIRYMTKMV